MSLGVLIAVVAPLPASPEHGRERVRLQRDHSRRALAASADASGCTATGFAKDPDDVPLARDGWHWSVSHARGHVAACVHRAPVGIDVESLRAVRREVVERALSPRELARLELGGELGFLRAWTAKESLLKELGLGLAGLSRCEILACCAADELVLECDGQRRVVRQLLERDHVVSVSCADAAHVTWVACAAPLAPREEELA